MGNRASSSLKQSLIRYGKAVTRASSSAKDIDHALDDVYRFPPADVLAMVTEELRARFDVRRATIYEPLYVEMFGRVEPSARSVEWNRADDATIVPLVRACIASADGSLIDELLSYVDRVPITRCNSRCIALELAFPVVRNDPRLAKLLGACAEAATIGCNWRVLLRIANVYYSDVERATFLRKVLRECKSTAPRLIDDGLYFDMEGIVEDCQGRIKEQLTDMELVEELNGIVAHWVSR